MKTSGRSWTFINQSNPTESIIVHDAHSAECLQSILKHHEEWFLKEEAVKYAAPPPEPRIGPPSRAAGPALLGSNQPEHAPRASPPPLPPGPVAKPVEDRRIPHEDRRYSDKDRRATPRFSTEFRVVLITGAHSYRNTSEDVSMGGMKLKRPVPLAFISQKCTIFISHPDLRENVQVSCKVLADPKDPRRVQFTETDPVQLKRLEEWLAESVLRSKKGVA